MGATSSLRKLFGLNDQSFDASSSLQDMGDASWDGQVNGGSQTPLNGPISQEAAPVFRNVIQVFDASDQLVGTFTSLQAANDASADGYTILVAQGTYNGPVTITHDVTIIGPKSGISGTNGARNGTGEAIINGGLYIAHDGVTLDGFTLQGAGFLNLGLDRDSSLVIGASNVSVVNSILSGDGQTGSDVRPFEVFNGSKNVFFDSNSVTHWAEGGYLVLGTTGTFSHNSFVNNGNGIITESEGVVIDSNDFRDSLGAHIALATFENPSDASTVVLATNTHDFDRILAIYPNLGGPLTFTGSELGDRLVGEAATGPVTFDGLGGNDYAVGTTFNDTLLGGSGNDMLQAEGGNDRLDGGTGVDVMIGGLGDDTYVVDNVLDTVTEAAGEGTDTVESSINLVAGLASNVENLTLVGTAQYGAGNSDANIVTGNALDNVLLGLGGNDTLRGGSGIDNLIGGAGADVLDGGADFDIASYSGSAAVYVNLAGGFGAGGDAQGDTFIGIEAVIGSSNSDALFGSTNGDVLFGDAGGDFISGDAGADFISGGSGNDGLTGGAGNDIFYYTSGFGNDGIYDFDQNGDDIIFFSGFGADVDFSDLVLTAFGGNTVVTSAAFSGSIFLQGTSINQVQADDFFFA